MTTILYLTDLYYQASGRKYHEEDLYVTSKLKDHFNLLICHPRQAIPHIEYADLIVFRNTGPVIGYQKYFIEFLAEIQRKKALTFNSFDGNGDMKGKQYLLDLTRLRYPVIPTVENLEDLDRLGRPDKYILKLKNGADSIGMEMLTQNEVIRLKPNGKLIQPYLDFEYEVSFYYLNDDFQYAMYAPDKQKRWELAEYEPTSRDIQFADKFIKWNGLTRGISRVDACRLKDGSLLLMELEDLNPYLSLVLLEEKKRDLFIDKLIEALKIFAKQTT